MIQLIGRSGGWSLNRMESGILKRGLNQVDDLTLPAVSPQPPNPQVDCKLPHLAGTSKNSYMCKNLKLLLAKSYKLWGSFMVFTFRVKNVKTSLGARNLVSRR